MTQAMDLAGFLFAALAEPRGLLLRTGDPHRARMALYAARRAMAEPRLAELQLRLWDGLDGDLVVVKASALGAVPRTQGPRAPNPGEALARP